MEKERTVETHSTYLLSRQKTKDWVHRFRNESHVVHTGFVHKETQRTDIGISRIREI